ncbi:MULTISPECIES: acyltransferase [Bhargavaea]|uniref:Acyltransferase n=1 Tax=Bhargavaea changchunensis TaxID=2134037 RepID=A0ABW2NI28_9BACL|nr:acyltransferase family protein [Bhargavaea sp. CC-171006]
MKRTSYFEEDLMNQKIFYGVDLIKVIAILSVVSVHFLLNTDFYNSPIIGTSLTLQVFWRQLFIVCVPLFLIATGFLQWKKEWNKKYFKSVLNVIYIYLVLSVVIILARALYFGEERTILEWIQSVFEFKGIRYAWYVEMYIGLALLIPFLNNIWKAFKTKKEFQVFLLILIFTTSVPGFWNVFNNDIPYLSVIEFPDFWMRLYPITFYFLGVYIRKHGLSISPMRSFFMFLIVTSIETAIICIKSGDGTIVNAVGGYHSILIVVQSVFLFAAFYKMEAPVSKIGKVMSIPITSISVLTLDIYLASAITDKFVYQYFYEHFFTTQKYAILYAPLCVISSFVLAYSIALLRHRLLPLKRRNKTGK